MPRKRIIRRNGAVIERQQIIAGKASPRTSSVLFSYPSAGVYMGDRAGLWRVGLGGKNLTPLARDANFARLYVDGPDLFWLTIDGAIMVTNKNP